MKNIVIAFAVGASLLISAAASETAEKHYIPLLMENGSTVDLYWMKLDQNGALLRGPALVRDAASFVTSAAIVAEGNKMLFSDADAATMTSPVYSVGVNPRNGRVVNGPTQIANVWTDLVPEGWPLSISKDGRKFTYSRDKAPSSYDFDCFLKKFKPNGSVRPSTVTIAGTSEPEIFPMITDDGLGVYYLSVLSGTETVFFQKLTPRGRPTGTRIPALTLPGLSVFPPMVDAERRWMSYRTYSTYDLWVTRLSATGAATGTPVNVTTLGPNLEAFGGLTRDARLVVYTLRSSSPRTYALYSQRLDANGNPAGAPVLLIPASTTMMFPWYLAEF